MLPTAAVPPTCRPPAAASLACPPAHLPPCRRVWDVATGRCEASLNDHRNPALTYVQFTPNGTYVLTCE